MKKILTASLVILSLSLFIAGCKTPDTTPSNPETNTPTNTDDDNPPDSNEPPVPGDLIADNEFLKSLKMPEANIGENPFTGKSFQSHSYTISFDDDYCTLFQLIEGNRCFKYTYKYDNEKKIIALQCYAISDDRTNYIKIEDFYKQKKKDLDLPENEEEAKILYEQKGSDKSWEEWKEQRRQYFGLPDNYTWDDFVYANNGYIIGYSYAHFLGVAYLSYEINGNNLKFEPYILEHVTFKDLFYKYGTIYFETDNGWFYSSGKECNFLFCFETDTIFENYILIKITDEKLYLQSLFMKDSVIEIPYKYDFSSKNTDDWKLTITLDGEEMDCNLDLGHRIMNGGYTLLSN